MCIWGNKYSESCMFLLLKGQQVSDMYKELKEWNSSIEVWIYIVKILFMGEILHQHLYKRSSSLLPPTHGVCIILAPYRSLEVLRVGEKHKTFALVSHYEHPMYIH